MSLHQQTLQQEARISGYGLHTGAPSTLCIKPAEAGHGLVFQREDLEGGPLIPALADYVVDTSRGTTIGKGNATVATVEHVLSALMGMGIDNALLVLDGPEPPGGDGSALAFVNAIQEAGIVKQDAERRFLVVQETISFVDEESGISLKIEPAKEYSLHVEIDFGTEVTGPPSASYSFSSNRYAEDVSNNRTFCFLHEVEALYHAGLIQGGSLESAVVFVDKSLSDEELDSLRQRYGNISSLSGPGVLNQEGLRHENEAARHKLLDLIGDLCLIGAPIQGKVTATKPGHTANVELSRIARKELKRQILSLRFMKELQPGLVFDINAIHEILPHRYPFLLVDKITEFSDNKIIGIKNVTINEPFFQGHFPGNPIMPGVLQLEAMAQVGGILLLNNIENPKTIWVYFLAIDNARFKKPVKPGDTLTLELEMTAMKRNICKMTGKGYVDGVLVCSADLVASVVPK